MDARDKRQDQAANGLACPASRLALADEGCYARMRVARRGTLASKSAVTW